MKRYDEQILNRLLDKYENSLLYSGRNKVNRSITVAVTEKMLPDYFDPSGLQYEVIHQQLEQIEANGHVRLIWKNGKKGHILEKCELITEQAEAVYRRLRRKPRNVKEQEVLQICATYRGKGHILDNFLNWVESRIHEGSSVQKYVDFDQPKNFQRLCELIFRILSNENECFLRQFSVEYFHDSKIVEKDISRAVQVISSFSGEEQLEGLEEEALLAEYNIYRNPSWLMMKGNARFNTQGSADTEVDLSRFEGGLGISNEDVEKINWASIRQIERVITVENLTSFHQCRIREESADLYVYLGGYHNKVKREFLKKLYEAYPDAEFLHFGDIDCGGFRIWKDLCLKTGIHFKTLHMDEETYEQYLEMGRVLTEQDRKTLKQMLRDPFFEEQKALFERMLQHGMKLEQECIV